MLNKFHVVSYVQWALEQILNKSEKLREVYELKEAFFELTKQKDKKEGLKKGLKTGYTNGYTEEKE